MPVVRVTFLTVFSTWGLKFSILLRVIPKYFALLDQFIIWLFIVNRLEFLNLKRLKRTATVLSQFIFSRHLAVAGVGSWLCFCYDLG